MATRNPLAPNRDWYSVEIDTLRLGFGVAIAAALIVGGYFGFQSWQAYQVEQNAFEVVASSRSLIKQLADEEGLEQHRAEYRRAEDQLTQAEAALEVENFHAAGEFGGLSYNILSTILDQIRHRGQPGIAWFISVEGDVRYSRGGTGEFVRAHARDTLYEGDYIQSKKGSSAEIYFHFEDTRFTISPDTFFQLRRQGGRGGQPQSLGVLDKGWVELGTSRSSSGVSTRHSQVTVQEDSRASVSSSNDVSNVRVNRGKALIRTSGGETRELAERQQVQQSGEVLGKTEELPAQPDLLTPMDNESINIDTTREIVLGWNEVDGATRYALQISRSRLFGETIEDVQDRTNTEATLGLREEGAYFWRVAAFDRAGRQGDWSAPRTFKVASWRGLDLDQDVDPPVLEMTVKMIGDIAILQGKTEPGAEVKMNGRSIPVTADGEISTAERIEAEGTVTLVFRAVDEAGNPSVVEKEVYVDPN